MDPAKECIMAMASIVVFFFFIRRKRKKKGKGRKSRTLSFRQTQTNPPIGPRTANPPVLLHVQTCVHGALPEHEQASVYGVNLTCFLLGLNTRKQKPACSSI